MRAMPGSAGVRFVWRVPRDMLAPSLPGVVVLPGRGAAREGTGQARRTAGPASGVG